MISPRLAEVAAENWLKSQGYQTRRTVRTQWQMIDFFGADVIGKGKEDTVYIQVTVSQQSKHVMERRRKLEQIPWTETDYVCVFQYVERKSISNPRRKERFFRSYVYDAYPDGERRWLSNSAINITPDMLKAHAHLPKEDSGAINSEKGIPSQLSPGSSGTNEGD